MGWTCETCGERSESEDVQDAMNHELKNKGHIVNPDSNTAQKWYEAGLI